MTDTQDSNLLLAERLKQRAEFGLAKYSKPLKPWDGRNTVVDAIEEALDLAVYLTKLQQERDEIAGIFYDIGDWAFDADVKEPEQMYAILIDIAKKAQDMYHRLSADIPRIGSKSEAEIERETWAAVKGPSERLADMSTPL